MKIAGIAVCAAGLAMAQQSANPVVYPASKQGGQYMHNYYIPPAPSSTPWWPAWSPDGKRIAIAMYGSIWIVDPSSGNASELTYGKTYHSSPAWSPDGKWIAYTADDDARSINVEIADAGTGQSRALTAGGDIYLDPVFSPDGGRLAYVSTRPNGHFNIYVRPVRDGQWAGNEIAVTRDNKYPRDRLYFGAWDMYTQPAWTRDGRSLLFSSNRGVPLGSGDLMRMPAVAGGIDDAVRVHSEQTLYRTRPDVSPDGKRVVYSSTAGAADQYSHLYVIPVEGGAPYKLTFGQWDEFHPRWSPDGEWIAYISNEGGLPQLWLLETYGGGRRKVDLQLKWKRPMGKLRLRVVDAKGNPTAARIHGLAADGKFYPPRTAYSRLGRASIHTFHTQGEEVMELPPGRIRLEAVKGFQHSPAVAEADIKAGAETAATLRMEKPAQLAWDGWWSGSTHVHMNYGGNLRNTPDNLMRMARSEALDLILDQVANKDNRILDHEWFVKGGGEHPASKGDPAVKLLVGQEYRPPFYGHVSFLGLRDHLISPFTTGYEGTGIESLYPSNTDMFRKARAQGALVGYVHAYSGETDPLERDLGVAKAFPVDLALGVVDTIEWSAASRATHIVWRHAMNTGLKVTPVGGEDSITNLHRTKLIGSVRTYAYLGKALTVESWLQAVREGKAFMSTGPMLDLKINGALPGGEVRLPEAGGRVTVEARAASIAPLSKVVLYRNGTVFRELPLDAAKTSASLKEQVDVGESSWFSLYAEGPSFDLLDGEYPQAATNAIQVYRGGRKIRNRASAEYFLRWIDKLQSMAAAWPWWRSEKEKQHVYGQFEEARAVYRKLAGEAP